MQLVGCTKHEAPTHLLDERGHLLLAVLELGLDALALGVVRLHVLLGLVETLHEDLVHLQFTTHHKHDARISRPNITRLNPK